MLFPAPEGPITAIRDPGSAITSDEPLRQRLPLPFPLGGAKVLGHARLLAERGARVITRAEDIYVWDSEGKKILDAMSGLWCVNAGYGRKELADAAYQQMMTLPFYNSFFNTTNVPAVKLAKEKVIDTTAAGDSFSAGYLAVRLTGGTPEAAAQRGHLTASTVIQYRGAIIPREAMPA